MLINCITCGKTISSKKNNCIYCRTNLTPYLEELSQGKSTRTVREKHPGTLLALLLKTRTH